MLKLFLDFIEFLFSGVVFANNRMNESIFKRLRFGYDELNVDNMYTAIQLYFFFFMGIVCAFFVHVYFILNGLDVHSGGMIMFVLFDVGIWYYIGHVIKKRLQRKRFIENLLEEYDTYSKEYKKKKIIIWIIKYLIVITSPAYLTILGKLFLQWLQE